MTDLSNENQALIMSALGQTYWEPDDCYVWMSAATEGDLNDLMNAVRREERERAIAVLRPFAAEHARLEKAHWKHPEPDDFSALGMIKWGSFRAASSYITQAEGADK